MKPKVTTKQMTVMQEGEIATGSPIVSDLCSTFFCLRCEQEFDWNERQDVCPTCFGACRAGDFRDPFERGRTKSE
jgi:Zn finger protein HypA/HybF involved in hydrogenase expression